jgi:hypothetical protein
MRAMVSLDEVVEVCTLPQFARIWHDPFRFQLFERFRIGRIFINRDDARRADMRHSKCFREEVFGRFRILRILVVDTRQLLISAWK